MMQYHDTILHHITRYGSVSFHMKSWWYCTTLIISYKYTVSCHTILYHETISFQKILFFHAYTFWYCTWCFKGIIWYFMYQQTHPSRKFQWERTRLSHHLWKWRKVTWTMKLVRIAFSPKHSNLLWNTQKTSPASTSR